MPDSLDRTNWPRGRLTAALLRDELQAIGVPADQARQVVPSRDALGREYVRLGTLSVDNADRLLAALTSRAAPGAVEG